MVSDQSDSGAPESPPNNPKRADVPDCPRDQHGRFVPRPGLPTPSGWARPGGPRKSRTGIRQLRDEVDAFAAHLCTPLDRHQQSLLRIALSKTCSTAEGVMLFLQQPVIREMLKKELDREDPPQLTLTLGESLPVPVQWRENGDNGTVRPDAGGMEPARD